jgi:hypothetical protein
LKWFQNHWTEGFFTTSVASDAELSTAVAENITVSSELQNMFTAASNLLDMAHFLSTTLSALCGDICLLFFERINFLSVVSMLLGLHKLLFLLDLLHLLLIRLLELLILRHVVVSCTEALGACPLHVGVRVTTLVGNLFGAVAAL